MPFALFSQSNGIPVPLITGSIGGFNPESSAIVCESEHRIFIVNPKTKEKKKISTLTWDATPKWSPDGKTIVFQSYGKLSSSSTFAIWMVNPDGTNLRQVSPLNTEVAGQYPYWSPDSKKIAWTQGKQLWIANADGKNAKPLTISPAIEYENILDWSKDGKTILYARRDGYMVEDKLQLWTIDVDTQQQTKINDISDMNAAKFSEDGTTIYFLKNDNYINSYNTKTKQIAKFLELKCKTGVSNFQFSADFKTVLFDDEGPNVDSRVYILKAK